MNQRILWSGFIATSLMTLILYAPKLLALEPFLDIAAAIGGIFSVAYLPEPSSILWWLGLSAHFLNGTLIFPTIFNRLFNLRQPENFPGESVMKGVAGGLVLWTAAMLVFLPLSGNGVFGRQLDDTLWVDVGTLVAHLIYGGILGLLCRQKALVINRAL